MTGWAVLAFIELLLTAWTASAYPILSLVFNNSNQGTAWLLIGVLVSQAATCVLLDACAVYSFLFSTPIFSDMTTIRYAFGVVEVRRDDIEELSFLQGGQGWRYIGLRQQSSWTVITNSLVSDRDFQGLADAIQSWFLGRKTAVPVEWGANSPGKLGSGSFRFARIKLYTFIYALAFTLMLGLVLTFRPTRISDSTTGYVRMKCIVSTMGILRDCRIIEERPSNRGFGNATLQLAPKFKLRPAMKAGAPVQSTTIIPIRWRNPAK